MAVEKPSIKSFYTIDWHTARWGRGKIAPAPEDVVVHFTGSGGEGGSAIGTYKDWLLRPINSRCNAHYIVDAGGIYECVDPKKYACLYACAVKPAESHIKFYIDGNGEASPQACSHIKVAGNYNTINIEACSAKRTPVSRRPNAYMDDDFYFPDDTYRNLVSLVAWLLDSFSIRLANLIMHHNISGKLCPAMWCNSKEAFNGWTAFKNDVSLVLNKPVMAPDLPKPSGVGTDSGTGVDGTISVKEGDPFYMNSDGSIVLGYSKKDQALSYTFIRNGMYYTPLGYVKGA
jgi:N-acetylmuramoyl-L-alanine amidase CwlA